MGISIRFTKANQHVNMSTCQRVIDCIYIYIYILRVRSNYTHRDYIYIYIHHFCIILFSEYYFMILSHILLIFSEISPCSKKNAESFWSPKSCCFLVVPSKPQEMSDEGGIVTHLTALEEIASMKVLCSDKTGAAAAECSMGSYGSMDEIP